MAAPARSRLLELTRLRCDVFSTLYNPLGLRTGAKYLRARLRGPSMVQYYPKQLSFKDLSRAMPELKLVNFEEEQRLFDVAERKKRGKGAPKKAKSPGTWDFACSSCTTLTHNVQRRADVLQRKRESNRLFGCTARFVSHTIPRYCVVYYSMQLLWATRSVLEKGSNFTTGKLYRTKRSLLRRKGKSKCRIPGDHATLKY